MPASFPPPACFVLSAKPAEKKADTRVGGQAVIEGVMMRGRRFWALAVRKPDGTIYSQVKPLRSFLVRHPSWDKPFGRGIFILGESLALGWRALSLSADIALEEENQNRASGRKAFGTIEKAFSLIVAILLAVGLFIALPTWLGPLLVGRSSPVWAWNLVEGGIRIAIFIAYLALVSLSKEMRRVFEYHGAEHQSIHVWEKGEPLEPDAALREGTEHIRCGTAFILLVLVLTVLVYSFLGRPALWLRILERLAIIPLIAGVSYEIMRLADRRRSRLLKVIVVPGLALQKLTTRRPDREQAEVALTALRLLLAEEGRGE
ncbi:MAG: hypothetical protein A2V52_00585 [Actinobacteria bacterium RBG_19FT_COMBO_54_7]|nr:MAG: hypothetical protein A2V52_00585 [Actinobacteria bacterium RBG_19FT_COMBO_54_7]